MAYKHGVYVSEQPTSLVPMTSTDSGLIIVVGTAPVHLATKAAKANEPKLCYTYKEAVEAFGYSADWKKYTLCEAMKSQFTYFNMAPIVLINVLDPAKHKIDVDNAEVAFVDKVAKISEAVLLDTLVVKATSAGQVLVEDTDYTAAYNDEGALEITALDGGALDGVATCTVSYDRLDPSQISPDDVVGGVDSVTGAAEGLELVEEIYPRFGLVPGIIIAPGFSHNTTVAAAMRAKTTNICGHFKAICICDIPTETVKNYTEASQWKNLNNFVNENTLLCWPLLKLGDEVFHMSTQLASLMNATDSKNNDIPYHSPSNQSLQADAAILADGTEIYLNSSNAAYLNGQGIVTTLNFIGGWKLWGNRTTAYPSVTDVKDSFIALRRMFAWVGNTLITTFWQKIDAPTNKRLIATIVDSANIWLNGLTAKGYLLGGRVEFREDENTITDLMDGKIYFHVYITPPSPARDIEFVQEYDPQYINTLFD